METFPLGGIITLLVLLPNLAAALLPPLHPLPGGPHTRPSAPAWLTVIERVGQIACFALPFLYPLRVDGLHQFAALAVMLAALAIYYAGWLRYVLRGRYEADYYRPLLGIPLPMALMPVIYFFAAGVLLGSPWLVLAAVILGFGHINVTRFSAAR